MFDAQAPFEDDRELVEGWSLAGLDPAGRATHVGDAGGSCPRVDPPNVFGDQFGFVAGGLDARWVRDQGGHGAVLRSYVANSFGNGLKIIFILVKMLTRRIGCEGISSEAS